MEVSNEDLDSISLSKVDTRSLYLTIASAFFATMAGGMRFAQLLGEQQSLLSSGSPEDLVKAQRCGDEMSARLSLFIGPNTERTLEDFTIFMEDQIGRGVVDEWVELARIDGFSRYDNTEPEKSPSEDEGRVMSKGASATNEKEDKKRRARDGSKNKQSDGKSGLTRAKHSKAFTNKGSPNKKRKKVANATKRTERLSLVQAQRNAIVEEGLNFIEDVSKELASYPVVARKMNSLQLSKYIAAQVERAFDPRDPELSRLAQIVKNLVVLIQNLAIYLKKLKAYDLACEKKDGNASEDALMGIDLSAGLGSLLLCIEKDEYNENEDDNDPSVAEASQSLSDLKAALCRARIGSDRSKMERGDILVMKKMIGLKQWLKNILSHCLNALVVIEGVEPNLSMYELYKHDTVLEDRTAATELWDAVKPNETFETSKVSVRMYREEVVLPALSMERTKLKAATVARDMSLKITDTSLGPSGERQELILPLFKSALNKTIEGKEAICSVDYCGGTSDSHGKRRRKMTCSAYVLTVPSIIETQLPAGTFTDGVTRALLVCSQTNVKGYKFQDVDEQGLPVVYGNEDDTAQSIIARLATEKRKCEKAQSSYKDGVNQSVIIDSNTLKPLRELLQL